MDMGIMLVHITIPMGIYALATIQVTPILSLSVYKLASVKFRLKLV